MKKAFSVITVSFFLIVCFGLGACLLLRPQREFSENENRYLQTTPEFSLSALSDGSYIKKLENSFSDQIALRNEWIALHSELLYLCGNRDIGGAYIGEDGFYFEALSNADILTERYERNLSNINTFSENFDGKVYVMLAPSSSDILSEKLPENCMQYDTDAVFEKACSVLEGCEFIDLRNAMEILGGDAYYKTDHHWTAYGAFCAYEQWCEATGCVSEPQESFELRQLCDDFRGTLYSKVLLESSAYETIYAPAENSEITAEYNGESFEIYHYEKLETKDKYAVFFGGNYGRLDVFGADPNGEKVLVIKDSFANSFVPFAAENCSQITMIDLRFFNGSLKAISNEYDEVLFLYEISNFARDTNLFKLLM